MSDIVKAQSFNIYNREGWNVLTEQNGQKFDDRPMISDPLNGMIINATHYPVGFYKPFHRHPMSHGIFVIRGHLKTDDGVYGPGSLVWHPAGYQCGHGATEYDDCLFLFIANHAFGIEFLNEAHRPARQQIQPTVFNINDMEGWEVLTDPDGQTIDNKDMVTDPDTGMIINVTHLHKGYYKARHRHPMSHGIYVISGKLRTEDGIYGPGSLVWHPAGYEGRHGATDDCDCTYLFIANKGFEIEYL